MTFRDKVRGPVLDERGYAGGERNRVLSPEEVQWARMEYAKRRESARSLADRFELSIDSIRRMLRGETYRNVATALPRAEQFRQETDLDKKAVEAMDKLAAEIAAAPAKPEPPIGEAKRVMDEIYPVGAPVEIKREEAAKALVPDGPTDANGELIGNTLPEGESGFE